VQPCTATAIVDVWSEAGIAVAFFAGAMSAY
jgi:hypothetical protein